MKSPFSRSLFGFALIALLAAGAYAIVRTPFAGWTAGQALPSARMLSPAGGGETPFTLDPDDTSPTEPRTGRTAAPASFDGDVRDLPQIGPAEKTLGVEFKPAGFQGFDPDFIDPVTQENPGGGIPDPVLNFIGLDLADHGSGWPPDTNGDIGWAHYIQVVNTSIGIFDRDGVELAAFTFDSLFTGTGTPCDGDNNGDPVVLFDDTVGRWIVTDFAWIDLMSGPYFECIAVSKTSDPVTGGWWFYALDTFNPGDPGAPLHYLNDYPKLGVWHDGIYLTSNMYDCLTPSCSSAQYKGVKVWVFNRDDLIAGAPLNYQYVNVGAAFFGLIPSHARGDHMPPAGTPNYLGAIDFTASSTFRTWKFDVDWIVPASTTFTGPFVTTVAAYTHPGDIPQLAGELVDSLSGRLMATLQYTRVGGTPALWVTHSVTTMGRSGIRWYELRGLTGTPSVFQEGTYSPDATHRWMGAVAVDETGNLAIVYSASSASIHPQIRYAGRLVGDPLGTLGQGENTLIAGTGSQSGGFGRWGDYAGMMLDPKDGCTFWFTTEYYSATGSDWQTRIGTFAYPECTEPPVFTEHIYLPIIKRVAP